MEGAPNENKLDTQTQGHLVRKLTREDALSYLKKVKEQFKTQPEVYEQFLDVMKQFKSFGLDTIGVVEKIAVLFRGYPELLNGFNPFLPHGYKLEVQSNLQVQITVPVTNIVGESTLMSTPPTVFARELQTGMAIHPAQTIQSDLSSPVKLLLSFSGIFQSVKEEAPKSTFHLAGSSMSSSGDGTSLEFLDYLDKEFSGQLAATPIHPVEKFQLDQLSPVKPLHSSETLEMENDGIQSSEFHNLTGSSISYLGDDSLLEYLDSSGKSKELCGSPVATSIHTSFHSQSNHSMPEKLLPPFQIFQRKSDISQSSFSCDLAYSSMSDSCDGTPNRSLKCLDEEPSEASVEESDNPTTESH